MARDRTRGSGRAGVGLRRHRRGPAGTLRHPLIDRLTLVDAAGRQAAIARTKRERVRCDEAIGAANKKVGELTSELKAVTPSDSRNVWIQSPDDRRPSDVAHGRRLLTEAIADQRASQQRYEDSVAEATRLQQRASDAGEAARAFGEVRAPLEARLDQPDIALSAFPLWVRMRNDADLRAGLKHIRVAEVVRRQLPEPFSDDDASSNGTGAGHPHRHTRLSQAGVSIAPPPASAGTPVTPRAARLAAELEAWGRRTITLAELWPLFARADPASATRQTRRADLAASIAALARPAW